METSNFNIEELGISVCNIEYVFHELTKEKCDIINIESHFPHAKVQLLQLYDLRPDYRKKIYDLIMYSIDEVKETIQNSELNSKKEREQTLNNFKAIIDRTFKEDSKDISINDVERVKLEINMPNNVIYDLIKQLKQLTFDDKNIVLSQSYDVIAEFFIQNVKGFEKSNAKNLAQEMAREQTIKKGKLEVKKVY